MSRSQHPLTAPRGRGTVLRCTRSPRAVLVEWTVWLTYGNLTGPEGMGVVVPEEISGHLP